MTTAVPIAPAAPSVSQVQEQSASTNGAASLGVTLTLTPRKGDVLVASLALPSATVTVTSISQTGVTWSQWLSKSGTGIEVYTWLGIVTGPVPSANLTINLSVSSALVAHVSEWSGLNAASATTVVLASGSGASGSGQSADTGTVAATKQTNLQGLSAYPQGLVVAAAALATATGGAGFPTNGFLPTLLQANGLTATGVTLLGAFLNQAQPTAQVTYYVSPAGNDSYPGTQGLPFATLYQAAEFAVAANDGTHTAISVIVAPGVYPLNNTKGSITHGAWFSETGAPQSGSPQARIRYISQVKYGAVMQFPANWTSFEAFEITGDYVSVEGFTFDCSLLAAASRQNGVHARGNANLITGCKFLQCDAGVDLDEYGSATPRFSRVTGCKFINCGVTADTTGGAIILEQRDCLIDNNLIVESASNGIISRFDSTQQTVVNNTIANCTLAGIQMGVTGAFVNDYCLVANNIVRNCATGIKEATASGGTSGTHNQYLNNDVYNCTTAYVLLNGLTPSGGITSDPLMVNYQPDGSGDYHLTASSPCIDAGIATMANDLDLDGLSRPHGAGYDIGCYEYGAVAGDTQRASWALGATGVNYAGIAGILSPLQPGDQPGTGTGSNGFYRAYTLLNEPVSPKLYLRFNEPEGAPNFADQSGNGYFATPTGMVTPGYAGMLAGDAESQGCTLFDGATGYVDTTYQPSGLTRWTLRVWLAPDGVAPGGSTPYIVATNQVNTDKVGFELTLSAPGAGATYACRFGDGVNAYTVTSGASPAILFTRQQVIVTCDSVTSQTLNFYLDGVLVNSVALGGPISMAAATHALRVGATPGSPAQFFGGFVEELAFFENVAFSATQVQADYIAGVRGAATQQPAASVYGFKQQVVMVYSPAGAFIDVWRDAPLLAGVKFALNSATSVLRVQLPRKFDNFDEGGAPGSRGSIAQGNIVQYWLFGPGLPSGGLLKYQGVIDAYNPAIAENGEESVTVTITPFDSAVADNGLLGDVTFGQPNVPASYVDAVSVFNYWFNTADTAIAPFATRTYAAPLGVDGTNPASSGNLVQYSFANQQLDSIFNTTLQMLPANWYWRPNANRTVSLNVPPVTAQHLFVIGQHLVAPQYKKDWTRLRNIIQVIGNGLTTALTTALTSGTPYTTLAVAPLPIALTAGQTLIINDGGNPTQTVTVAAVAASGATSVTVTGFNANANYAVQTQVAIYIAGLVHGSDTGTYGYRVAQLADNRVTDQATATLLADGLLAQLDAMVLRTTIRLVDYRGDAQSGMGYDIESIQPGDTCMIVNPANEASGTLWDVAKWDVDYWDYVPSATLQLVAIIFGVQYSFDAVDLDIGFFAPNDARDLLSLRVKFQDFSLGKA